MKKRATLVLPKHIKKGIDRYEGKLNEQLVPHLQNASWNYTPYTFKDGRILLVFAGETYALLYPNMEAVFKDLEDAFSEK